MPFIGAARCRTWRRIVKQARSRPRSSSSSLSHRTRMLRAELALSLSRPMAREPSTRSPASFDPLRLLAADHAGATELLDLNGSTPGQPAHRLRENPTSPAIAALPGLQSDDAFLCLITWHCTTQSASVKASARRKRPLLDDHRLLTAQYCLIPADLNVKWAVAPDRRTRALRLHAGMHGRLLRRALRPQAEGCETGGWRRRDVG
jgi:hypothetical protein